MVRTCVLKMINDCVNNTKLFTETLKLKENVIYTNEQNEKMYIIILQNNYINNYFV